MHLRINKLRALSTVGSLLLVGLGAWAVWRYETATLATLVRSTAIGVVVFALPRIVPSARLWGRRLRDAAGGDGDSETDAFVSETPVGDTEGVLQRATDGIATTDGCELVERKQFSAGPGLVVRDRNHRALFVRVAASDRLAVTGNTDRTRALAASLEDHCGLAFERSRPVRFESPGRTEGLLRVALGVFTLVALIAGVTGVTAAAYPGDAYNPVEESVLVGIDALGETPLLSTDQRRLTKAAFLVDVLDEKSVELRMVNQSASATAHANQSVVISERVCELTGEVQASSPTAAQADRIDRIERELARAQGEVTTAVAERQRNVTDPEYETRLGNVRTRLRNGSCA